VLTWGTEDELFPLDHARRLRDAFPHAELIEIPECSAFVMLDAAGRLAEVIRGG
jgi:pimeloyl-ACP methyl ester carboxylesterase